jgi:hypothetical protein
MLRLALIIYAIAGPTVAGSLVVAALVGGFDTTRGILVAALLGFALAAPVAWMVAGRIGGERR